MNSAPKALQSHRNSNNSRRIASRLALREVPHAFYNNAHGTMCGVSALPAATMIILYDANGREIDRTLAGDRTGARRHRIKDRSDGVARSPLGFSGASAPIVKTNSAARREGV